MPDRLRAPLVTKHGFPPVIDETSQVLILGTMPSEASLRCQEYYGHPRNQFWRILAEVYRVPFATTYPDRVALLRRKRLAVWDVVQYGEREGSLDQAIRNVVPNDFRGLFETYGNLRVIAFNGRKAQDLFAHKVLRQQALNNFDRIPRLLMPSTSPAATMPLTEKAKCWCRIADL